MKNTKQNISTPFDDINGNDVPVPNEYVPNISHEFDDIINLPHPEPKLPHRRMSMHQRAAQFSPFAALSGYGDAVEEAHRLTAEEITFDASYKEELDYKIQQILENGIQNSEVEITYFQPDSRKEGRGAYLTSTGRIKKIDEYQRKIVLQDGTAIPMEQVSGLEMI